MKFKILFGCFAMGMFSLAAGAQTRVLSTDLTNIAAASSGGRVIAVTSTYSNKKEYAGENLIDGRVWGGNNTSSKGWVSDKFDPIDMDAVTLGFAGNRIYRIGRIVINPANDQTPERWAKDIEIQTSTETAEGPWNPVAQLSLTQTPTPQTFDMLPAQARFVRLVVRTNYGSDRAVALGEVEIYESIGDSDPIGALITRFEGALGELKGYRKDRMENGAIPTSGGSTTSPMREVQLAAAGISTGKTNIAAAKNGGKVLAFSSKYNNDDSFGPEKLIDGDNYREADNKGSNGWASNSFVPGQEYVTLGFARDATKVIDRFIINPASNQSNGRWARRMDVQVTTGNFKDGPWKDITTINLKPQAINQEFSFRPVEAKYVRFVFRANGPGDFVLPGGDPNVYSDRAVSLGEIEIYESATPDDKLDSVIGRLNQVLVDMKTLRRRQIDTDNAPDAPAAPIAFTPASEPKPAQPSVATAAPKPAVASPVAAAKPAVTAPKPTVAAVSKPATKIAPPKSVREAIAPKKANPTKG